MRILFITQVADRDDPYLSFVARWIAAFASVFEKMTVICLKEGEHDFPANVRTLSLGKETGGNRFSYSLRFYRHLWRERKNYDAVFVHMNQEYVLLAGLWWRLTGKRVYLWRNHYAGSFLTGIAAALCTNVFCTSRHSYTARYPKTVFMPVGVDADLFKPVHGVRRIPRSILFFGRMAPSKRGEVLLQALGILAKKGVGFAADFVGDALPQDAAYLASLRQQAGRLGQGAAVSFKPGIPNSETPALYSAHDLYVNLSPSGMFDKTIFEAMACGCIALASSKDLRGSVSDAYLFDEGDAESLAKKLEAALALDPAARAGVSWDQGSFVAKQHSLDALVRRLAFQMDPQNGAQ